MSNELVATWYQSLIDDLKNIERTSIVFGKHAIGKRILEDIGKLDRQEYGSKTVENIAQDLDASRTEIYRCIQFSKKYPELSHDMGQLSWYRITQELLPDKPHVSQASGENEWYTPPQYIEAARQVMGSIDLDPASCETANETVSAMEYFDIDDDGLEQEWHGNIWMNPPYAQPFVDKFSEAVTEKYQNNEIKQACILVNNATETEWFQRMLRVASAVCFIKTRVKFLDKEGSASGAPLQGQAILYMGSNTVSFKTAFVGVGEVLIHG